MIKTFLKLLGDDASIFRQYVLMAALYGLISGLTMVSLVPIITHLLNNEIRQVYTWLIVLFVGVLISWLLRRKVENAGMNVGAASLSTARQRLGDHISGLPVGWFTPDNTSRLSHVISQGMM